MEKLIRLPGGACCCAVVTLLAFTPGIHSQSKVANFSEYEDRITATLDAYTRGMETEAFTKKRRFAEVLEDLNRRVGPAKKVVIRVDKEAFAGQVERILEAEVQVRTKAKFITMSGLLRQLLAQALPEKGMATIRLDRGEIVITTPKRAMQIMAYDVDDLVRQPRLLYTMLSARGDDVFPGVNDLKSTDGIGLLMRLVGQHATKSVIVENGTRLVIEAENEHHLNIGSILDSCRWLMDVAVVVDAKVYELDMKTYRKHVAPLFVDRKDGNETLTLAACPDAVATIVTRQLPVAHGREGKLLPLQQSHFLSKQTLYRYRGRVTGDSAAGYTHTGLEGYVFSLTPTMSSDRRSLRLSVVQKVAQLVSIDKAKALHPVTGEAAVIEVPNVRHQVSFGTLDLNDGAPFVMKVEFVPPEKDKIWVLFARPQILIEAEEREIRKAAAPGVSRLRVTFAHGSHS